MLSEEGRRLEDVSTINETEEVRLSSARPVGPTERGKKFFLCIKTIRTDSDCFYVLFSFVSASYLMMQSVFDHLLKHVNNMFIIVRIVNRRPLPAIFNESQIFKKSELMRDC